MYVVDRECIVAPKHSGEKLLVEGFRISSRTNLASILHGLRTILKKRVRSSSSTMWIVGGLSRFADQVKEIGLARGECSAAAVPFVKFPVARENKDHGSPTWESFVIS